MSEFLTKENVNKVVIALMLGAIGYIFNMIFDLKHTVVIVEEQQEKIKRQWQGISENKIVGAINRNDIEWLKKKK